MGLNFARGLSLAAGIPVAGVNHIEGHLLAPMLDNPELEAPYLALVASGGHTEIIDVQSVGRYSLVARTIDDAAGEAFDKSAGLLGLPYPGGPLLAKMADDFAAAGGTISPEFKLPRVMVGASGFSFSGLKTAIALLIKRQGDKIRQDDRLRSALALAIQEAIVDALIVKLKMAINDTGIRRVVVTGGVSANQLLRNRVASLKEVRAFFPNPLHCMDNAAMIAFVAVKRTAHGLSNCLESEALSRWPVEGR